jgi:WD40-like Beta Propeller Repeat
LPYLKVFFDRLFFFSGTSVTIDNWGSDIDDYPHRIYDGKYLAEEVRELSMPRAKSFPEKYLKYIISLLILSGLMTASIRFGPRYLYRFWGYVWLDRVESRLTGRQIKDIKTGLQGLKAKIAWSSSRTGNHEIFLLNLPDLKMYQITHNNFVDYFPRFSPDGEKILFCRSQRPWVSERDVEPWDVYTYSLTDNRETLVAKNGNSAQWINNRQISFVRKNKLMIKNLENGKEELVLDGNQKPISSEIGTPEFSPRNTNLLAFTGRGKMHGVFIWDRARKSFLEIGQGCEITWVPSGREVIWVNDRGNGGTQIMKSTADQARPTLFIDLPGQYSHEYFPRLSRNGRWLVWAASAGGHEHDIADYEIFLWEVGAPFSRAIRLTFNQANDRWPDIYIQN